jgi:hypothetical protein
MFANLPRKWVESRKTMKSFITVLVLVLASSIFTGCISGKPFSKKGNWRKPGVEYCTGYYCNDSERRNNWWQN